MAAAERLATSSRVKGHWELPESDSVGTRIFGVFWFGQLFCELVKRSLQFLPLLGFTPFNVRVGSPPPGKHHLFNVLVGVLNRGVDFSQHVLNFGRTRDGPNFVWVGFCSDYGDSMPPNRLQEAIRPGNGWERQDLQPNYSFLKCFAYFKLQLTNPGYSPLL